MTGAISSHLSPSTTKEAPSVYPRGFPYCQNLIFYHSGRILPVDSRSILGFGINTEAASTTSSTKSHHAETPSHIASTVSSTVSCTQPSPTLSVIACNASFILQAAHVTSSHNVGPVYQGVTSSIQSLSTRYFVSHAVSFHADFHNVIKLKLRSVSQPSLSITFILIVDHHICHNMRTCPSISSLHIFFSLYSFHISSVHFTRI